MRKHSSNLFYSAIAAALIIFTATQSSFGQVTSGEKAKIHGLITARTGEAVTVKTADKGDVVVNITDNTTIKAKKGVLGVRRDNMAVTALIPGLKVDVEGTGNDKGQIDAKSIDFSTGDLRTAQTIQAGLAPTQKELQQTQQQTQENKKATQANKAEIQANQQRIQAGQEELAKVSTDEAALHKRFSELSDYDVKVAAVVYFPSNSAALNEAAKRDLDDLARVAAGLKGYLIQVAGFASSTGSAALNQRLSEERSAAVVNYLAQTGQIPLRHIMAPAAMGTTQPAATNQTAEGRAYNRRVEVKVLVNKGLAGN
jgi:OmpA-OmpF porin, OOP family